MPITKKKPSEWSAATIAAIKTAFGWFSLSGILKMDGSGGMSVATPDEDYASVESTKKVSGVNDQTGTEYTLTLADAGKYVRCTNASSITITVPANSTVAYPNGTVITVEQGGAGQVTVSGDAGVTINALYSGYSTAGQYGAIQIVKTATDEWTLIGGTEA